MSDTAEMWAMPASELTIVPCPQRAAWSIVNRRGDLLAVGGYGDWLRRTGRPGCQRTGPGAGGPGVREGAFGVPGGGGPADREGVVEAGGTGGGGAVGGGHVADRAGGAGGWRKPRSDANPASSRYRSVM